MSKKRPIDLTFDAAFKMYFKSNPELLTSLLETFLPLSTIGHIAKIELMDTELGAFPNKYLKKTFLLDIKVRIYRQRMGEEKVMSEIADVEMQTSSLKGFTNRLVVYVGRILSDQLTAGEDYKELPTVYSVVFITKNLSEFNTKALAHEYYHHNTMRREGVPDTLFNDRTQHITVELGKFNKEVDKLVDQRDAWCYLLKNSTKINKKIGKKLITKGKDMKNAVNYLWKLSEDELAKEIQEAEKKRRMDIKAQIDWERDEVIVIGIKKGIEQGIEKNNQEVALKMLEEEMDITMICKVTGLSKKQIEKLQRSVTRSKAKKGKT